MKANGLIRSTERIPSTDELALNMGNFCSPPSRDEPDLAMAYRNGLTSALLSNGINTNSGTIADISEPGAPLNSWAPTVTTESMLALLRPHLLAQICAAAAVLQTHPDGSDAQPLLSPCDRVLLDSHKPQKPKILGNGIPLAYKQLTSGKSVFKATSLPAGFPRLVIHSPRWSFEFTISLYYSQPGCKPLYTRGSAHALHMF